MFNSATLLSTTIPGDTAEAPWDFSAGMGHVVPFHTQVHGPNPEAKIGRKEEQEVVDLRGNRKS